MQMKELYDEIKSMDPTFSMAQLHDELVLWRNEVDSLSGDTRELYDLLSGCDIYPRSIGGEIEWYSVRLGDGDEDIDVDDIWDKIASMGYHVEIIVEGSKHAWIDILSEEWLDSLLRKIAGITVLHPIRRIQYRFTRLYMDSGEYNPHDSHTVKSPIMEDGYDEDLYLAIRAIDPSINMNTLYNIYLDKYKRENAPWPLDPTITVRDMYEIWYPYLDWIDKIEYHPFFLRITTTRDVGLNDLLGDVPGWSCTSQHMTYRGDHRDALYDSILTMLRMYHSYNVPHIDGVGVIYHDTY